jgi:hypothetical protein
VSGWACAGAEHEAIHLVLLGRCAQTHHGSCHFWAKSLRCLGFDKGQTTYAPKGFADIASLTIRPNRAPNFLPDRYREKAKRWRELWPELTVLPA